MVLVKPGDPGRLAETVIELLQDDARRREIGVRTIGKHFAWTPFAPARWRFTGG